MTNPNHEKRGITREDIKFLILVTTTIIALTASWVRMESRLDHEQELLSSQCSRVDKLESRIDSLDPVLLDIRLSLGRLQTDVQWIRLEVDKLTQEAP